MSTLVIAVIGGLLLGGTYALIGLGLVQAFRSTGTFNLAHGQMMIFPALLIAGWEASNRFPMSVAIPLALAAAGLLGLVMFVLLRRTIGRPHFIGFVATLGIASVLDGVFRMWFGPGVRQLTIPALPDGRVVILGTGVSSRDLTAACVAIFVAVAVAAFMRFTESGVRIRAAGLNAVLASQGGINVRRLYRGSWVLSGLLAGFAGILFCASHPFDLTTTEVALSVVPAIVLGGLDSTEGAVVGGLTIGLIQGFTASYLGGDNVNVVTYSLLLVLLLIYPSGLFGTSAVRRV
jgi:branched-chain amino acid transport system permease protein